MTTAMDIDLTELADRLEAAGAERRWLSSDGYVLTLMIRGTARIRVSRDGWVVIRGSWLYTSQIWSYLHVIDNAIRGKQS